VFCVLCFGFRGIVFRDSGFWGEGSAPTLRTKWDFGVRVPGSGCRVSGFGFRVSGFGCRVSGVGLRGSGFEFRVSVVGCRVSGFGFRGSGFGCRVSDVGFRVSGFGLRVSGFGFGGTVQQPGAGPSAHLASAAPALSRSPVAPPTAMEKRKLFVHDGSGFTSSLK